MDPENITLGNALEATNDLYIRQLSQHVKVGPMPAGVVTPVSLPLRDLSRSAQQMRHFFDVIYDHARNISYDALAPILRDQAWSELPPPFGVKKDLGVNYLMQLFVIPQKNDGKHCIVKHIFIPDHKVKAALILEAGYGTMQEIVWGNNAKNTKKALQFMLDQLGGVQFRIFALTPALKKAPKGIPEKSEEDLDKGFEYIRVHGERDKGALKQLLWIQKAITGDTPIKGWRDGLVQRCLDSLATDATMSKLVTRYDLTMADFDEQFQNIFQGIVPYLREHALWILGEPGKGKTPLGRVLAMMFSRLHGGPGCYRSASDFDYFRGAPFSTHVPAIYDDGDIGAEPIKKKKAFSDVSDEETLTRERWTAAKFVQNQLRIVIDNSYAPAHEPTMPMDINPSIPHEDFIKMLRPALGALPVYAMLSYLVQSIFKT